MCFCICLFISELKRIQQTDLENLEKTLKETETSLSVSLVHVLIFTQFHGHMVLKMSAWKQETACVY